MPWCQPVLSRSSFTVSPYEPRGFALHVADGSEIIAGRVGGRNLTILVGRHGSERYGSCLARLVPARLARGYLPLLQTAYVDADGDHYQQESFVARLPGTKLLASFVRLSVNTVRTVAVVRLLPSEAELHATKSGLETAALYGRDPTPGGLGHWPPSRPGRTV